MTVQANMAGAQPMARRFGAVLPLLKGLVAIAAVLLAVELLVIAFGWFIQRAFDVTIPVFSVLLPG